MLQKGNETINAEYHERKWNHEFEMQLEGVDVNCRTHQSLLEAHHLIGFRLSRTYEFHHTL